MMFKLCELILVAIYLILYVAKRQIARKVIENDEYLRERYKLPNNTGGIIKIVVMTVFIVGCAGPILEGLSLLYCIYDGVQSYITIGKLERFGNLL